MAQSTYSAVARSQRPSTRAARAALAAPCFIAIFSLSSGAHAEGAEAQPSAQVPTAQPSAQVPTAQPSAHAPAVEQSAAPAARESAELPAIDARHEGFYLRIASGPSLVSLRGHGPSGSASITGEGSSGSIAIGAAVVPGLVLAGTLQGQEITSDFNGGPLANATVSVGAESHTASHKAEGGIGMIGLLVDWYPKPTGGWHTGASAGLGAIGLTNLADDSDLAGVNFTGSVFGGYDWALGRDWALGLQLTASGGTTTKLKEDDFDHDTGYRLTPLSLGIQASVLYF